MVMQHSALQAKYSKREIAAVRDTGRISERLIYKIAQICIHKCISKISFRTRYAVYKDNGRDSASVLSLFKEGHLQGITL